MTKEELEKEAEEYAIGLFPNDVFKQSAVIQGIIKFTEPREKRIAELEQQIENIYANHCGNCNRNILNSELKRENAELKEQHRVDLIQIQAILNQRSIQNTKLAKAKEILAKLLEEEKNNMYWEMNGADKSSYYEVRKQAEQLLKEIK